MRRALIWTLALLVLPSPVVAQPAGPFPGQVTYCSRECSPYDVNDNDTTNLPVNVVLYAHIFDALQRAPLNVIPPDPTKEPDINAGFPAPTATIEKDVVYFQNNGFTLFHYPSMIRYDGALQTQKEPLAYPMKLGAKDAKFYWYLSPYVVPGANSSTTPVGGIGLVPLLNVHVRVETGPHPFYGQLIAEGNTSTATMIGLPGTDYAYEFAVPLEIKMREVPPEGGFVVHVDWYQYDQDSRQVMQSDWRIRSGIRFVPRLILPIENPVALSDVTTVYRSQTQYIMTDIASLFGAYDLNPFKLNLTVKSGPSAAPNPVPVYYFPNSRIPNSVRIVWAMPNEDHTLKAGTYTFQLRASNLPGTYELHQDVPVDVAYLEFKSSKSRVPGFDAAFLILAILAVTLVVARRR